MKRDRLPLAKWTYQIPEGEIRRLLKYQVKYYFGGGLPGALPVEKLATIVRDIGEDLLREIGNGQTATANRLFNYAKSPGSDSLRKLLLKQLVKRQELAFDPESDFEKMLITAGAQQSIYGLLDATVNPGDYILSAGPSYLGFVTPAVKMGGKVVLCPSDENGLTVEGVERAIRAVKKQSGAAPKMLYVISDSDNPKGTTLPWNRRKALFDIAEKEGMLIVEDAAYKEIQFTRQRVKPIKSLDVDNRRVAYLCSTSKEAGVLRLGYSIFPDYIRPNVEKARGFYDLCSPTITQEIAERYYSLNIDEILTDVLTTYRKRCTTMTEAVGFYFPKGEQTHPTGGFFVWWEASHQPDFDAKLFNETIGIPNEVLFVPSRAFYPPEGWIVGADEKLHAVAPRNNGMRLSFSAVPPEKITEGIQQLGSLLKSHLNS